MPTSWIQFDGGAKVVRAHAHQRDAVLSVRVERGVREALACKRRRGAVAYWHVEAISRSMVRSRVPSNSPKNFDFPNSIA